MRRNVTQIKGVRLRVMKEYEYAGNCCCVIFTEKISLANIWIQVRVCVAARLGDNIIYETVFCLNGPCIYLLLKVCAQFSSLECN